MLFEIAIPGFEKIINRSYTAQALNDMSMLSALFHRDGIALDKIPEWLKTKAKEEFMNPFTVEPYQWNAKGKSLKIVLDKKLKLNKDSITVPLGSGMEMPLMEEK